MKVKSGKLPSFELVSEGVHVFEVGEPKWLENGEGESKDMFFVPCVVAEGGEEDGRTVNMFVRLKNQTSRKAFALLLWATGVAETLEKQFNIPPDKSDDDWAKMLSTEKGEKVLNNALIKLPGTKFKGTVGHRTYKVKDTGEDRTTAEIKEVEPVSASSAKKSEPADDDDVIW